MEYSSSTSFEDICSLTEECSISSVSDFTDSEGKSVCIVCGTCDTVIPFPVHVKGLTGNIDWLKTIELACFYQVKSKTLNDLYICHKDKKRFYNYYDYYLKDIESKIDIPQSKTNVQSHVDTTTNQEKTLPSDKLDEESKSSLSSTVSNITNQLKNIASTSSNHIS